MYFKYCVLTMFLLVLILPGSSMSQSMLDIFLDCDRCDDRYIRTELTFVNYITEPQEADVYILVTEERLGSGGRIYTLCFCGQKNFTGLNDTLTYETHRINTEDEIREGFVKVLSGGLMRFVSRTPLIKKISIGYNEEAGEEIVLDRWNYWVFRVRTNGYLKAEETQQSYSINGRFSANRITEAWKIRLNLNAAYDEEDFDTDEGTIVSYSRGRNFWGLIVKSISDHWSLGTYLTAYSSTYSNINASYGIGPAIEYNLYPYSQSTRRELRFLYSLDFDYVYYIERTIYDKKREVLLQHELEIDYEIKERWGQIDIGLDASFYAHDMDKNRFRLRSEFDIRLFKGFSLSLNTGISLIHDQLSIPIEDLTTEEILLQRNELATQYEVWGALGFSYTFGSIYNNIVNTRF